MTDKVTQQRADEGNTKKDPDHWTTGDEPMTERSGRIYISRRKPAQR